MNEVFCQNSEVPTSRLTVGSFMDFVFQLRLQPLEDIDDEFLVNWERIPIETVDGVYTGWDGESYSNRRRDSVRNGESLLKKGCGREDWADTLGEGVIKFQLGPDSDDARELIEKHPQQMFFGGKRVDVGIVVLAKGANRPVLFGKFFEIRRTEVETIRLDSRRAVKKILYFLFHGSFKPSSDKGSVTHSVTVGSDQVDVGRFYEFVKRCSREKGFSAHCYLVARLKKDD